MGTSGSWEKAEVEAMEKPGCICHYSFLFSLLLAPSLHMAAVPLAALCAQQSRKTCCDLAKEAADGRRGGGERASEELWWRGARLSTT